MAESDERNTPTLTQAPVPEEVLELDPGLRIGEAVDRYVIVDFLGMGGMGLVLKAYDPQLKRNIALKLVQGEDARDNRRLLGEAEAMAQLSHPNIVTVHDAGVLGDRVFIAMELVDGIDLRHWLDEHPDASWDQILELYRQAGRGLAAVHDAGLVHRDFKPDNVLVGRDGRVRVTDFGLARRGRYPGATSGSIEGTPSYMSPAQWQGKPCEPRDDQFSFCAALYESLFHRPAFAGDSWKQLRRSVLNAQVNEPPATVPASVRRALMTGLRHDPDHRHPDMQTLLEQLGWDPQRRRRRRAIASVGAGLLFSLAALGVVSPLAVTRSCRYQVARRWETAVQMPELSTAFAAPGKSYLRDTWARLEPTLESFRDDWKSAAVDVCRGEQAGESVELMRLQKEVCLDHRLQQMRYTTSAWLGGDRQALDRALEDVYEVPPVEICQSEQGLLEWGAQHFKALGTGELEHVRRAMELSSHAEAERADTAAAVRYAEEAVEHARASGLAPVIARARLTLAKAHFNASEFPEAMTLIRQLEQSEYAGADNRIQLELLHAKASKVSGAYREAERWATEVIEQSLDDEPLVAARALGLRAAVRWSLARFPEAVKDAQRAVALERRYHGPRHPRVGSALHVLGIAQWKAGDLGAAHRSLVEAEELQRAVFGEDHPLVSSTHHDLAIIHLEEGRLQQAAEAFEEVLRVREAARGPSHTTLASVHNNLGVVLMRQGDVDQAVEHFDRALAIRRRQWGNDSPRLTTTLMNVARAEMMRGHLVRALELATEVLDVRRAHLGPDHVDTAAAQMRIARILQLQGHIEQAEHEVERALPVFERLAPDHRELGGAHLDAGLIYSVRHCDRAVPHLRRALKILADEADPYPRGRARFALGRCLEDPPTVAAAIRELEKTPQNAPELASARAWLQARRRL